MSSSISGLNTPLTGLQRAAARTEKASRDLQTSFAAAQNAQAADSVQVDGRAAVIPAIEDAVRGAALPAEGGVTEALVNLLQAKTAYKANTSTLRVMDDLQASLMKIGNSGKTA